VSDHERVELSAGRAHTLDAVRLVVLLGSGASAAADMPTVQTITEQVLSGRGVGRVGGDFHIRARTPIHEEEAARPTLEFVRRLRDLCDEYFQWLDKTRFGEPRATNYEDIAYVARQIEDAITSEYENPALRPLLDDLTFALDISLRELGESAELAVGYILDTVRHMLGRTPNIASIATIVSGFQDPRISRLDLATLNHDTVVETALRDAATPFSDGFELEYGTLRIWSDTYSESSRRLLKLHGSVDWYRYDVTIDGRERRVTARPIGDPFHPSGPDGDDLGHPIGGRPLFLAGTFDKILRYPTGLYADQHANFHRALGRADRLLIAGYGFGDKAINARIVDWADSQPQRRIVIVHPNPTRLRKGARGAVRNPWEAWQERGTLGFVKKRVGGNLGWEEIYAALLVRN
jgi:hypothetical protein